ncbi:MAG: bile acid:sodium symporter family protein [Gammaproteobacteria bacterium]|nr:bile acid:sodium symporter family protein [Gammaproteobacteria bacterium]MBU0786706.1 bile acid:sodium symporter family protein [Gammaproteobacteria bacterium]MBU0814088.1 bile acid:sodium symporter family protein [Gammaproteobacteria bacterium]MBU1788439.1 bile acid:sodium symporter family protein [Gammaproteobacteria bacterium]
MTIQQLILSLVLATMVFSVALELRVDDFKRVAKTPWAVLCGLIPQFILLPVGTWLATLLLDLPANIEAAMILVAACPGGSLSNVVTHIGRGNTALSVSVSAVASVIALFATPFNFSWMIATNPGTAAWLRELAIDPSGIWISLLLLLAIPMALGLVFSHRLPALTERIRKPLGHFAVIALLLFIVGALIKERQLLTLGLLPLLLIVVLHNASGLFFGWATSMVMRVSEKDRRAVMIEGGMQNSGLALGIIAVQFNSDLGMVTLASLWGMWHIVSGMSLAYFWRRKDARSAL